jgi:hypothetical protein
MAQPARDPRCRHRHDRPTAIFATLKQDPALGWKVATGAVSLVAVVFAGLQTFLNFSERAQKHVVSATGYSKVRRRLEHFLLLYEHASDSRRDSALADLS